MTPGDWIALAMFIIGAATAEAGIVLYIANNFRIISERLTRIETVLGIVYKAGMNGRTYVSFNAGSGVQANADMADNVT